MNLQERLKELIGEEEDLNAPAETYGKDDQSLGDNPFPNPNLQYVVRRATRNVFRADQQKKASALVTTIAADLKGMLPKEKQYKKLEMCFHCGNRQYSCACSDAYNRALTEMSAAIDR